MEITESQKQLIANIAEHATDRRQWAVDSVRHELNRALEALARLAEQETPSAMSIAGVSRQLMDIAMKANERDAHHEAERSAKVLLKGLGMEAAK